MGVQVKNQLFFGNDMKKTGGMSRKMYDFLSTGVNKYNYIPIMRTK